MKLQTHVRHAVYQSRGAASRDMRDSRGRFRSTGADEDRFWAQVQLARGDGCWLWTGPLTDDGYPRFRLKDRPVRAHRWAYERLVGPIPAGLTLDHLCEVPACVRPDHLEPVTRSENLRRRHARRRAAQKGATR